MAARAAKESVIDLLVVHECFIRQQPSFFGDEGQGSFLPFLFFFPNSARWHMLLSCPSSGDAADEAEMPRLLYEPAISLDNEWTDPS